MGDLITLGQVRPTDWAGDFVPGARVTFFLSNTTTPAVVYQDEPETIPFAQPISANADGVFPAIFRSATLRAVVTDALGVPLPGSPIDPCVRSFTTLGAASAVSFTPTAEVPVANVQSAIERVQVNIGTRLSGAGVGVTQAPLLANIDTTATPSGRYRYDTSSTGLFPVGVVKADTGVIVISSGAVGNQVMELTPRDGGNQFFRAMVALTWGAWVQSIDSLDVASQAEAEAGVENTKFMTALRVQQAVALTARVYATSVVVSGATVNFTGIPSTAREIEVLFHNINVASGVPLVQLMVGGVAVATGYNSAAGTSGAELLSTDGFITTPSNLALSGIMRIVRAASGLWVSSCSFRAGSAESSGGGSISGVGTVDGIRLASTGGNYNAGTAVVSWR